MEVHLVDATYELFRAHFSPRPPVLGRNGQVLSGVSGLVEQLCYLLREQGGTHVGCATDRVIESFRNDLYAGYKTSAGMPPELLAQFPIAEQAIEALGVTLWPMVEFEADDAIAAAAGRFAAAAIASSASNSTIGHSVTPSASIACSAMGNWASSSGGIPALVLYPFHKLLRKLSMMWSLATATWVAPSASSWRVERSTPTVAANGPGSVSLARRPKFWRNSS